jgi:hypothetical protein
MADSYQNNSQGPRLRFRFVGGAGPSPQLGYARTNSSGTSRVFHVARGVMKVAFGLIHFTLGLQLLVIHTLPAVSLMPPLACQQRPRRVLDPSLVPPSQRRAWTPSQCSWNLVHFVLLGHRNGLTEQLIEATKMSRKTGLAQTFKERAEECTRLSATAPLAAVREEYRTLASQYLALADAQRPRAAATKSRSGGKIFRFGKGAPSRRAAAP